GAVNLTGQLAGLDLLSRDELRARLGTGQALNPRRLSSNDITAISQNSPTLNGEVSVKPPDIDPSRGLVALPTEVTDAANQISSACPTSAEAADRLGSFIVSGRGGLPPNPTDLLSDDNTLTDWVTSTAKTPVQIPRSADRRAIVEAQGWSVSPDGKVMLVAPSENQAAGSPLTPSPCLSTLRDTPRDDR
ncbi:MAG TPA: S-layer family protein, partial [Coleofasciculaceae cyanobacterium]